MLDKIPTPLSGATCSEKNGWLPPNFDDLCREILSRTIDELLEAQPPDFDLNALTSSGSASKAVENTVEEAEMENLNEDENEVSAY